MSDSPTSEPESVFVCDCEKSMRSACDGEPFYGEHEGKRYCVLHFPGKEKSADFAAVLQRKLENEDFDFGGVWFPDEVSFAKFDFTPVANFSFATFSAAANFNEATFRGMASFLKATFSAEADFTVAKFLAEADFSWATFSAVASFSAAEFRADAHFSSATFSGAAVFIAATFSAVAHFSYVTFSVAAVFRSATFSAAADFRSATFSADADLSAATFGAQVYFTSATFADHVRFAGETVFSDTSSLDLQFARIEKPDHLSFHTLTLRPHWFVNVDPRKFDFTNVEWDCSINEEIESLKSNLVSLPQRLLAIACRHLAVNAEENHRYKEASRFRYMAMDSRRLQWHEITAPELKESKEKLQRGFFKAQWKAFKRTFTGITRSLRRNRKAQVRTRTSVKGFVSAYWKGFDSILWLYWAASGYGERALRAFVVLIGILLVSALIYTRVGFSRWEPRLVSEGNLATTKRDEVGTPLKWSRALTYSAGVMTLQKPEPRPATTAAQTVVLFETILGPVQAALLALAIRRKFMR